ncbi:DUF2235 domain-containing protein [Paraburkholderia fungorum]|uniref:DUF2235 domain-containing protein n=1 Tax=Paraburkholderia fungorum TaxID=134537 RepID=UPI00042297E8|nr:DUF2235 domain-containing protein [Paraburkholderia fungorum]PZR39098.1 MAG: hypothetical protein DI523_37340 [Paraburkholderia fungorum]
MEKQSRLDKDDATPQSVYRQVMAQESAAYPKGDCIPCGATIRVGFFFDAFGRSRDVDDQSSSEYSNISRLFEAHRDIKDFRRPVNQFWFRFYYSGLGTPLNEDANSNEWINAGLAALKVGGKQGLKTGKAMAESMARIKGPIDQADLGKRAKTAVKDAASDFSFRPVIKAYQDFKKDIQNIPRDVRRITNVLNASPERIWERTKAGGISLYRNAKTDIKRNPLKVVQTVARQLFTGILMENIPIVRDNSVMAEAFGTGVDTRLVAAMDQFKASYKAVQAKMPKIRAIEVSVFGADRGCVLARAFVNELAKKYKHRDDTDLQIEGVPIEIKFLGMLDAVSSIMSEEEGTVIGLIPFLGAIKPDYKDRPLGVPESVKRCIHFAAAHEMRFYQRLDSLEKTGGDQVLYPGTSSDVVGGAPAGSLGFNAELMRVPLQDMLLEAIRAGAAMDMMEDLSAYKPQTFDKFTVATPISCDGQQYRIRALVDAYRKIVPRTTGLDFLSHAKVFLRWIAVRYQDPDFRHSVTHPVTDWKQQFKDADLQLRTAKAKLDWEMQRQGVTMGMLSTRSPSDQAILLKLKADKDAAQGRYDSLLQTAPKEDFTSVWTRLDQEAHDMTSRWEKMEPGYEADQQRRFVQSFNHELKYTPIFMAPAFAHHVDLTEDQIALVKAWQTGIGGKDPLPDPVMKLFDMLVHDTLLTSWQDHVLAPTLYFRTRDKDVFGKTDFAKEDKQRKRDDDAAARVDRLRQGGASRFSADTP